MHTPALRLVSHHPLLSLTFAFMRVPQIHDGFRWKIFISRGTTVAAAVDAVIDELGLSRTLPVVGGGGNLEYILEEVWEYDSTESKFSQVLVTEV